MTHLINFHALADGLPEGQGQGLLNAISCSSPISK